ncbi:MAG: nucleotidyltransferase domain-containing protein [Bacteroidota bacterium]
MPDTLIASEPVIAGIQPEDRALLQFIAYFDVFDFPLTLHELANFTGNKNADKLAPVLQRLQKNKKINFLSGFYFLPGREQIIQKRKENENRAKKFFPKVPVWARLIQRFPFVRSVCISGSLSKGTMPKKGDVDYFIITEPGKLWVCRTLLILFKKIFLLNSKKYFCVNYFLDHDNLEVPDKNLFTATEIIFLVPLSGEKYHRQFLEANAWIKEYYPSFVHPYHLPSSQKKALIQQAAEFLLDNRAGDKLDDWFMRTTLARWKKKFPHFREEDFEIAMRTRKNVSKHHPNHFQEKVMQRFQLNMNNVVHQPEQ